MLFYHNNQRPQCKFSSTPAAAIAAALQREGGIAAVEWAARLSPHKVVVDDGALQLTYADMLDRVYGLAHALEAETAPAAVIASLVPNSAVCTVITLACAMTGRILVPIDSSHTSERQRAIFEESGATAVILSALAPVPEEFIPATIKRFTVDASQPTGAARPDIAPYDPSAPLFVAFTSGSTGRPKGVVSGGLYGSVTLAHFIEAFEIGPDDVILGVASLSTGGARDAFAALTTGAKIRITDVRALGLAEMLRILDEDKITVLSFIPSVLSMIMKMPDTERAFRHLRILDLHGEQILSSDIHLIRSKLPATCQISITMGSIEAGATFGWIVDDAKLDGKFAPVGYVLPRRRVALVNEQGQPAADGETGEIIARGPMALGAWRAGKILPGPYLPDPEDPAARIFPMGDLMRRRPDGLFDYIGRRDRRIKVHGQWADLGEIEAALRNCDGIADAAVIAASSREDRDHIAAFLTSTNPSAPPPLTALRHAVASQTAEHMVPETFTFVPEIPRLSNYKPDLARLAAGK